MKTGFFKQIDDSCHATIVSISLYPSNNDLVKFDYKALVPNWKLLDSLNKQNIAEEFFISSYREQLSLLDSKKVFNDLNSLSDKDDIILMTNGSKKNFCHRHLIAEWLQKELDIEIEEYRVGKVSRNNGYMKKIENPTLF